MLLTIQIFLCALTVGMEKVHQSKTTKSYSLKKGMRKRKKLRKIAFEKEATIENVRIHMRDVFEPNRSVDQI